MQSENNSLFISSRYKIIKEIGRGTMGKVYLIWDNRLEKYWAAKLINHSSGNELYSLKSINHNAFPRIVDVVYSFNNTWLVMDYFNGDPLDKYLQNNSLNIKDFVSLSLQLADALSYLHSYKTPLLYLDCKPSNILIEDGNILRLIDLGSTYMYQSPTPGQLTGSMGYASPEQLKKGPVDIRSDVYSYGMTLKYMLAHINTHRFLTLKRIISIINKCTQFSPGDRYQSMATICHKLRKCR